jgi:hypothetical protein
MKMEKLKLILNFTKIVEALTTCFLSFLIKIWIWEFLNISLSRQQIIIITIIFFTSYFINLFLEKKLN